MKSNIPLNGLIVTKNMQLLDVMTLVMDAMDVKLTVCLDKELAFDAVQGEKFDCVIIDWDPAIEPAGIIKAFRDNKMNAKSFVIAVVDDSSVYNQAYRSSVNMVIQNPNNYKQAM